MPLKVDMTMRCNAMQCDVRLRCDRLGHRPQDAAHGESRETMVQRRKMSQQYVTRGRSMNGFMWCMCVCVRVPGVGERCREPRNRKVGHALASMLLLIDSLPALTRWRAPSPDFCCPIDSSVPRICQIYVVAWVLS